MRYKCARGLSGSESKKVDNMFVRVGKISTFEREVWRLVVFWRALLSVSFSSTLLEMNRATYFCGR